MRNFVLVSATVALPNKSTKSCSGIRKLKRGTKLYEFISEYLEPMAVGDACETFTRSDSTTVIDRANDQVSTWTFTEFKEGELLDAVRHLTKEELLRDLKELLPLKDWK